MVALRGQPRSFLGINLSPAQVSLVELIDRGTRLELATYALADLPPDAAPAVSTYDKAATIQLVAFLREVFDQAALSSDAAIFSLYTPHLFSTIMELPAVADAELTAAIYYKAHDLIPADLRDLVITATRPHEHRHHVPLQPSRSTPVVLSPPLPAADKAASLHQPSAAKSRYLIHAIPLPTIAWYRDLARALDLELIALEENIFPISRIHPVTNSHCALYVQIDDQAVNLYAVGRDAVCLTRTIDLRAAGNSRDPSYLASEIDRTITRHRQSGFPAPAQIYLLGRNASLPDLQPALSRLLSCPVNLSQPFGGLTYPQGIEPSLAVQGPAFTVAVGLAKRELGHL